MESHTDPDRNDLLTHFQKMKNPDGSPVLSFDVLGESINVVVAGADTTVSLL
jgi:cytochrome P450